MTELTVHPLTLDRWGDYEALFGASGGYSGCWCTWWRQTRANYDKRGNAGNKEFAHSLVEDGVRLGLLGYIRGEPVAWISIAPRADYPSLQRSPVLRPIDDIPVWSLVCMLVAKTHRGRGLALQMIAAAADYVAEHGGQVIEAYPRIPKDDQPLTPDASFMGTPAMFETAGFERVAQPSTARAMYRLHLEKRGLLGLGGGP